MKKRYLRQAKITELIAQKHISTQEELIAELNKAGFAVTQATISRDIRDLHIAKTKDSNGAVYYRVYNEAPAAAAHDKLATAIRDGVISVTTVQFINVVKTMPQSASMINALWDELKEDDVVGSMAGYDTIILISKTPEQAAATRNWIMQFVEQDEFGKD